MFYTYLGAIPVNTFAGGDSSGTANPYDQLVPNDIPTASVINGQVNNTFQGYNGASSSGATAAQVTVNPLIDQGKVVTQGSNPQSSKTFYQQDPVSQAVLNILGTPDYTYCMDYNQVPTKFIDGCGYNYETLVSTNVVGEIPNAMTFFSPDYITQFLNQLNSNALTGPLMYSTQSLGGGSSNNGLTAQNQEQLAANFIRYVSGAAVPIKLPRKYDYDQMFQKTTSKDKTQQLQAQQTLGRYLASLRTYAAQSSVGLGNLYYIMSKRMPQTSKNQTGGGTGGQGGTGGSENATPMSQALSEFNMATWRLYTPATENAEGSSTSGTPSNTGTSSSGGSQWINKINNAAPATVEKEIAILLAEINYQLYLDRQVHERLLMTNSILLLQSVRTGAPSTDFTTQ